MDGSFLSSAFSKASSDWCCGPPSQYASVEAHHTITAREHLFLSRKARMSCSICSASWRFLPVLTLVPSSRLTQLWSKTADMGRMVERYSDIGSRRSLESTFALVAAV